MDREQILQVLYEMALVTGGETHVEPLISKTLQRLLYHTTFPCGVFLSVVKTNKNNTIDVYLEQVIGCGVLLKKKGEILALPKELIHGQAGLLDDVELIQNAFGENFKYKNALKLPVNDKELFILLSKNTPGFELPFERIFEPVLKNFGKTLILCRENDRYTYLLEQEVSRRTKLESSLLESRNLLQNVLNTVPSRIFWKDKNSAYLGCNNLFAQDAGLESSNEIIGKTDTDLPWGETEAESYRADDQAVMTSRDSKVRYEESQTREDGSDTWLETSKIPLINSSDDVIGVLGSYTDITERKRMEFDLKSSETRHRTIFESTVDGIININNKGIIESVNPAVEKLFGYTSNELTGNNISMLMPESFASQHDMYINKFSQAGHKTVLGRGRELVAQKKDGTVFPVDIALDEMFIDGERMFTGIIRDISERKEIEQKIIQAKEEAESANRAKSDFLSSMSHELRTPLNAILGFGQLIQMEEGLSADIKGNVNEIVNAGEHLLELINEVLDLAKIEAGHIDLLLESVEYNPLILECVSLVDPIARHNEIQIKNIFNTESIFLRSDRIRIKQVIVNLLSNAVKYNRKGGEVNIVVYPSGDNFYRISVKDTGAGIKNENLPGLFEAFNRLDAEDLNIEGTGIGLVITKRLVELMGGKIGVESEYGAGSTFWIEIPKETVSGSEINRSAEIESVQLEHDNDINFKEHKVLYIEDNPVNLKLVTKLFSKKSHIHLYTAHTPGLGLELAEINQPDLILLDIELPDMDGYKVLENLRSNTLTSHIPVVAVSANAMPNDFKKAKEAGFDDYLTKPLDIKNFYKTVDELLLVEK